MTNRSDPWPGMAAAVWAVVLVTALRIAALAVTRTDLWVDEAQYWAWGERLDFGYFSKPPLIGWVIRGFTEVFGDTAFAIRLAGPLCHGAAALILGRLAQELFGGRAGLWVAMGYVTLPMTALGSLLISTDTILAPFFALALLFWHRARGGGLAPAAVAGGALGLAFLAKYAAVYFWPGAVLAALLVPAWRLRWAQWGAALVAFGVVISPNVLWNLANDLTTVSHTMDNAGWLRTGVDLNLAGAAGFLATQFAVFGPVLFAGLLWLPFRRPGGDITALLAFAFPILAFVTVQALVSRAYGNWAVTAYFAASVAVLPWLYARARRGFWASLVVNIALCVAVPLVSLAPDWAVRPSGRPYLERYLGRAAFPQAVLDLAAAQGAGAVVTASRSLLANLLFEAEGRDIAVYSLPALGPPAHFYQQKMPWTSGAAEVALLVTGTGAPLCPAATVTPLDTRGTAWARQTLYAQRLPAACHAGLEPR